MINIRVVIDQDALADQLASGASNLVHSTALQIEAEMRRLMVLPKHGRQYPRAHGIHIASAPGEAPAVDTGTLINSIQTVIISDTEAEIRIAPEYAAYLELGTARMAARPFVGPAIEGVLARGRGAGLLAQVRG